MAGNYGRFNWTEYDVEQTYVAAAAFVLFAGPAAWGVGRGLFRWLVGPDVAGRWSRWGRLKLSVAAFAGGGFAVLRRLYEHAPAGWFDHADQWPNRWFVPDAYHYPMVWPAVGELAGCGLAVIVAVFVAVKLWAKWAGGATTAGERASGKVGLSAWFTAPNLTLATLAVLAAWFGYDASPLAAAAIAAVVLAAYPTWTTLNRPADVAAPPAADEPPLGSERARVLRLLEDGKVTAADAAELIAALTGSHVATATAGPGEPLPLHRKVGLAGLAVVLAGFFLPWFSFNPTAEVARAMRQMMAAAPMTGMPVPAVIGTTADGYTVTITGGDLGHGLGWLVLGFSAVTAVFPLLTPGVSAVVKRNVSVGAVAGGAVLVVYLLTSGPGSVGVGLALAAIGYAVQVVSVVRGGRWAWPAVGPAAGVAAEA